SDDELVGDFKSDIVNMRLLRRRPVLAQQHAALHAGSAELAQDGHDELDGSAAVEDVVDEQHMAATDVAELLADELRALGAQRLAGIAADGHQADLHLHWQLADEIAAEDHRAGEDRDDGDFRLTPRRPWREMIPRDLLGHLADAGHDLILRNEHTI